MRYTIENEFLKVEVADLGAELMSVVPLISTFVIKLGPL